MALATLRLYLDYAAPDVSRGRFAALAAKCDPAMIDEGPSLVVRGADSPIGFDPANFLEYSASEYAEQLPFGGHAAARTFIRNANRSISFTLDFHAVGGAGIPAGAARARQVRWPVALLDSLLYPDADIQAHGVRQYFAPPMVHVELSDVCHVRGFITNVHTVWHGGWGPDAAFAANPTRAQSVEDVTSNIMTPDHATVSVQMLGVGHGGGGYDGRAYHPFASATRVLR